MTQNVQEKPTKNSLELIRDRLMKDAVNLPYNAKCQDSYIEGYHNGVLDMFNEIKMGVADAKTRT